MPAFRQPQSAVNSLSVRAVQVSYFWWRRRLSSHEICREREPMIAVATTRAATKIADGFIGLPPADLPEAPLCRPPGAVAI
jgi:hypothetical protein